MKSSILNRLVQASINAIIQVNCNNMNEIHQLVHLYTKIRGDEKK